MILFLQIFGTILLIVLGLLLLIYIFKPALLILPYSTFISLFVRNPPYLELEEHFPEHKLLRENWELIRDELMVVLQNEMNVPKFHEVDSIQRFISAKDEIPWRTFIIKAYDKWSDSNSAQVPKTTELLKQLPQISTAMFSILDGGKHIPRHFGFFKGVLRYHLALIVPNDAPCYILVGGEKYSWAEGQDVLFVDTYMHEVRNESQHRRVVLFCDITRERNLPNWIRFMNKKMFNFLHTSNRLTKAMKKAEVAQEIETSGAKQKRA